LLPWPVHPPPTSNENLHYHRAFESVEKAILFRSLAACPDTAAGVVAELLESDG
jgi:hypothetical protein